MDINKPRCRRWWGDDGQPFSASSDPLSSKVMGSVEAKGKKGKKRKAKEVEEKVVTQI
jgi:hypothetical protein